MARPRAETTQKEPHYVSLKVLRLSRPTLAQSHPLPYHTITEPNFNINITASASLAYPQSIDKSFILAPNLSLPSSFGSAYVGETFSCSLCANDETLPSDSRPAGPSSSLSPSPTGLGRTISDITILAEMQTPSSASIPLTLQPSTAPSASKSSTSPPAKTLQRIIHHNLKEEGPHVLAVNVSYTESLPPYSTSTSPSATAQPTTRTRSFRKLYQFQTSPLLSIRTKASDLPPLSSPPSAPTPGPVPTRLRYVLEAQLENVSDSATVVVTKAELVPQPAFEVRGLNIDDDLTESNEMAKLGIVLAPRDVIQLSYLLTQHPPNSPGLEAGTIETIQADLKREGRTILGALSVEWRGTVGGRGLLSTGGLWTRRR